jgi:Mce-associated membrane protein
VTTKADKSKTGGPKPTKTKSSKDKAGKGKSGKTKSGKGKSGKTKSDDDRAAAAPLDFDASATEEAAAAGQDGASRTSLGGARRFLVTNFVAVVLGVVAVGLAVALVLTMQQVSNQNGVDSARTSALAAASKYSVELASYDYRHLVQDFGVVLAHSTPSFRSSFTESSNALKATLTKYHATASAKVVAAGVVSATASRVVALVLLDQTVTNSTQKQPTTDRSQVEITLVLTGGTWLIDQVTLL